MRGSEWAAYIDNLKQSLFQGRTKNIPRARTSMLDERPTGTQGSSETGVKILPPSYFTAEYANDKPDLKSLQEDIVNRFKLNEDQQRAFTLISNHASREQTEPLRMFLGGMGGTGKSTVIKALMEFFKRRQEDHRFLIMAPTGSAAALIDGFTYHSILGIKWGFKNENIDNLQGKNVRDIQQRLLGVDYVFIDEVSMLNCADMYRISASI
ncbi:P-loop containing nucleoside triphosphate hydrolase protein, partial [Schizophyllum fasciatum]